MSNDKLHELQRADGSTVEALAIRYAGDAWETFYGALETMAAHNYGVEITTADRQVYDGVLRPINGEVFSDDPMPTLIIENPNTHEVIATVPLYTNTDECNIIGIVVW